ncbi:MAG: hypothetical protein DSZ33_05835 [Gammaproteobacteria bacterium]|nr:MAG: hypothetical protein DSZ33_05835 [Gammaproteobacteria bacterium]
MVKMNNSYREQQAGYWRSAGRMALFLALFGLAATGIVSAGLPVYHFLKPVKRELSNSSVRLISASLADYQHLLKLQ